MDKTAAIAEIIEAWSPDLNEYAKSQFLHEIMRTVGEHELTVDCWCNPRVLVVEGAT